MILNSLVLENFRNYKKQEVKFNPNINIISGQNASGKTNLLEAICFLALTKSFLAKKEEDAILFGEPKSKISASLDAHNRRLTVDIELGKRNQKNVFLNGIRQPRLADFIGTFNCVLFCPDDLSLVQGYSTTRRRFLDTTLSQLNKNYLSALSKFNKVIEQKNSFLKKYIPSLENETLLSVYNTQIEELSAYITCWRGEYIKKISQNAALFQKQISGGKEALKITYLCDKEIADTRDVETNKLVFRHRTESKKDAEIAAGTSLIGIHKDDIDIKINGLSAKEFGSQGQARSAALSLKLAERQIIYQETGEYPVLLLDDVLSELDPMRQAFILKKIKKGQVFISCCDEICVKQYKNATVFNVKNGKVKHVSNDW